MEEADAIELVKQAIHAGIFNDLGSGSNVDITLIRLDGKAEVMRNFDTPNEQSDLRSSYTRPTAATVPRGATAVLSETKEAPSPYKPLMQLVTVEDAPAPMDI